MQFARGIDALQGMKPGPERDRLELDLQVGRGSACAVAYGHPAAETEKAWRRTVALLRDYPDDPRNYWARRGLSAALSAQGDMVAYAVIAEETMELARQSNDAAGLCVAHMMFANLYIYIRATLLNQSDPPATRPGSTVMVHLADRFSSPAWI